MSYSHDEYIAKNKKPLEPKFKVGDWVTDRTSNRQLTHQDIEFVCIWELWQPTEGEWCVFKDNNEDYRLGRYEYKDDNNLSFNEAIYDTILPLEFAMTLKDK